MIEEEKNPVLEKAVLTDTELKMLVVDYIGTNLEPEDDSVTVEMAIEVFASEFPEFVLAIAEENFFRGYEQALVDIQAVENNTSPT